MVRLGWLLAAAFWIPSDAYVTQDSKGLCSFKTFHGNHVAKEVVDPSNVPFRSNDVLVVESGSERRLVFLRKPAHKGEHAVCHEQASVTCDVDLDDHGQDSAAPCGTLPTCKAEGRPGLSYLRSMIGGALQFSQGRKLKRIASIGLGAGTLPVWFSQSMPEVTVDAVDISGDVVAAAPCFGVFESEKLRLVKQDGRAFLEQAKDGAFDAVFVDAFDDEDKIPGCLRTVEFFETVRSKLAPGGVLAMNTWSKEEKSVRSTLQAAFPGQEVQVGHSPGLGNLILLVQSAAKGQHSSFLGLGGVHGSASWAEDAYFFAPPAERRAPTYDNATCTGRAK